MALSKSMVFPTVLTIILFLSSLTLGNEANYEIIRPSSPVGWFEAKDSAENLGGQLVVINNLSAQETIASLLLENDTAWIGGTDLVVEGTWVWHNGADWLYSNWGPGQPDTSAISDYAQITYENNNIFLNINFF